MRLHSLVSSFWLRALASSSWPSRSWERGDRHTWHFISLTKALMLEHIDPDFVVCTNSFPDHFLRREPGTKAHQTHTDPTVGGWGSAAWPTAQRWELTLTMLLRSPFWDCRAWFSSDWALSLSSSLETLLSASSQAC